ncbi:MAG: TolC family protein, partial [Elusimicrobium sp.]|nr:TolC family protein [Elusimicrobium sp.]
GQYNLQSVRDDIERQVKEMAYMIFLSNAVAKVQQGHLDIAKQNLQEMKAKYKEGLSSNLDVLSQQVNVSNIEPLVIQADNNYELGTLYLKQLLNKDPEDNIYLTWNDFAAIKDPKPLEELYSLADGRPDLVLSKLNVDIAGQYVAVARAGNFPSLSAFGSKYYNAQTNSGLPGANDYYWTSTVGLRVSMPLFEGFRVKAQVTQKELAYESARQDYEDLQRSVRISIKSSWLSFYEAKKRMGSGGTVIEQSKQNLESMRKRYRAGLVSRLELDDATVALTNAQLQYVQAVHDALVALADLKFNVGSEVIK